MLYDRIVQVVYQTGGVWLYDIIMMWLTILWIWLAYNIYKRQEYNSNKDQELNRALSTANILSMDINIWQRKLEHLIEVGRVLEQKWDTVGGIQIQEALEELKISLDEYYEARAKIMEEYKMKLEEHYKNPFKLL
jgi:hypothetical protein